MFTEDQGDQEIPSKPKMYCKGNPCDNITAIKFLLAVELRQGASDFEELSDETIKQKIEEFGDGTVDEFVEFCCPSTRNYKCSVPLGKTTFISTDCTGRVPSKTSGSGNQCEECEKIQDEVQKKLHLATLIANAKRSIWSEPLHIDQREICKYPEASEAVLGE